MTAALFKSWEEAVLWLRREPGQHDLVIAAYYDDPLIDAANRYWNSAEWSALTEYFPAQRGRALDVGAGRGIASYALAKEGYQVTALEPNASDVVGAAAINELARTSDLSIDVVQEFSEQLPFPDNCFDLVFARAVLHHTSDLKAACREFFRVLKPGGHLIAIREHVISQSEDLQAFLDSHPLHKIYGGENAFLLKQYQGAIENAGFRIAVQLLPFDSAINYSPHTDGTLRELIATRLGSKVIGLRSFLIWLLKIPPVWAAARTVLNIVDHRPGRLYSFIARRPY